MQLTASVICGGPPVFSWWAGLQTPQGIAWQQLTGYQNGNVFAWNTTGLAVGAWYVGYWVESQGGPPNTYEAAISIQFNVS